MGSALASSTNTLQSQVTQKKRGIKKSSVPSAANIAAYAGAFLLLVAVVAVGYESPKNVSGQVANGGQEQLTAPAAAVDTEETPAVDQVVATGVAADLAARANLPIASNAANMSVSLTAKSELAQTDTAAITKPQIVTPTAANRAITSYVVQNGETVPQLASRFGVSEDTIRWANDINGDALEPGRTISVLPVTGVLYTTVAGDTAQSVAEKFKADPSRVTSFNDLELTGFTAGKQIIVPGGVKPAPVPVASASNNSFGGGSGSVVKSNLFGASAGNRYAPGNCTWYVFERREQLKRPIGSFWGNANTWASSARAAGLTVNRTPLPGAILTDQAGYFGHVAIVERVLPNGDVYITEMNNYAYGGFNIVNDRTISAGQASAYLYIH